MMVLPTVHRRFVALAVASLLTVLSAAAAVAEDFTLTILHSNDVHGRLEPSTPFGTGCRDQDIAQGRCFGGAARIATLVRQARQQTRNLLVLDAGDQFQGTLYYATHKDRAVVPMMSLIGYDAMALGNHEFDDGPDILARFVSALPFPVLSANLSADQVVGGPAGAAEATIARRVMPYTILERGGRRIGLVGVVTADTPRASSPGPTLHFAAEEPAVARAVDALSRQGVTHILLISHVGIGRDRDIARHVAGIDAIIGGHTHTLLSEEKIGGAAPEGPYPLVETGPDGRPVPIVTSWEHGRVLGRLDLVFDAAGRVTRWSGKAQPVTMGIPPAPDVQARIDELAKPIAALQAEVIGQTPEPLDGRASSCRIQECRLGRIAAEAILWRMAGDGVQIALQNGGGVRAGIPAGSISRGQVLEAFPFANTIATFTLTGAEMQRVLEHSVSQAGVGDPTNNAGRFLQVAGIRFDWDGRKPVGGRVSQVQVADQAGNWQPLDPLQRYRVAFNNFNRRGGDGYEMLSGAAEAYDFGPSLDETIVSFLAQQRHLSVPPAPLIRRLGIGSP